ncbi:L-threonine dehydratase biosynthetic [Desulfonema limicola]|uniref:L-threonine dehydratase biosynthetic n=1 Tax=Desulfonema limicola TaxID=45656 RepID=A0A975BC58_9BACT|nr:threonine ammonia-lyase [Desulfonema limicola]QTA82623.1 L-threonine dehydratase biosynthetic [Desulfonema limicola]
MIPIDNIYKAAEIIKKTVIRTPLVYSPTMSRIFGADIWLKLENLQKTGSFKIRGAAYKILTRKKEICPGGVVAASAGNHAQGVALAATNAGIKSTIVMPEWASISKQEATLSYGGKVVLAGQSIGESLKKAREIAEKGKTFIHPFDDLDIITGQGTIGLEILEDLKDADMLLVPIGGGGLISGTACAAKHLNPGIKIIGVQAAFCPSAYQSFLKGNISLVKSRLSIADGINVRQTGRLNFQIIKKYIDDIVLVKEEHIAAAILMLLERKKILAEGAGAVPLAALINRAVKIHPNTKIVLIISGGNVDSPLVGRIIQKGLLKNGRLMRVKLHLNDIPGSLSNLLSLIAGLKANILHIYHDRHIQDMALNMTYVELELETRGHDHINEIQESLNNSGYKSV